MKINYTDQGQILSFELLGGEYTHPLPNDFEQTFSLGKYQMNLDTLLIEEVEGWVAPNGFEPVVIPPNWDMLYGRFLAGDLKPIFDDVCLAGESNIAIALRYFNLVEAFKIRTEQALKDCLDKLFEAGYVVSEAHKLLWNTAIAELNFSDLVRLV